MRHPHSKAFLKPTVLTFISTFFVDPTVKITPIINKLQSDCSPEETLQRDNKKRSELQVFVMHQSSNVWLKAHWAGYQKRQVLHTVLALVTLGKSLNLSGTS